LFAAKQEVADFRSEHAEIMHSCRLWS